MKIFADIIHIITNISWAADFSATIVAMIIGYIWYHPVLLGGVWKRIANIDTSLFSSTKSLHLFLATFPITFIIAANIAAFCKHMTYTDPTRAFLIGYDLGLVICLFLAIIYLYEQRSLKLYIMHAGYTITAMSAMGFVIGKVL